MEEDLDRLPVRNIPRSSNASIDSKEFKSPALPGTRREQQLNVHSSSKKRNMFITAPNSPSPYRIPPPMARAKSKDNIYSLLTSSPNNPNSSDNHLISPPRHPNIHHTTPFQTPEAPQIRRPSHSHTQSIQRDRKMGFRTPHQL